MTDQALSNILRIIVDTHILVYREFDGYIPDQYQDLFTCINEFKIRILVHPLSLQEIEKDSNLKNKSIILSKVKTYPRLDNPPDADNDDEFHRLIKTSSDLRDRADSQLLYCVYKNVVDYFITEDRDIRLKAKILKISNRVLNVKQAIDFFRDNSAFKMTSGVHAEKLTFCFYNDGDYWKVGERGRETLFKGMSGFKFISFLLHNPNMPLSALAVYNAENNLTGIVADEMAYHEGLQIDDDILRSIKTDEKISPHKIKYEIERLKEKLDSGDYATPEEALKIKQDIDQLKNMIIDNSHKQKPRVSLKRIPRDHKSQGEKARVNVTKGIHSALQKIYKSNPHLGLYLNKSTVKTGDTFCYAPVVGQEPIWILKKQTILK